MLKISIVDNEEGLERLQVEWTQLLQQSSSDTIFLTWEWARAWWKSFGGGKKLCILKVAKNGELVALVPLYYKSFHRFGLFRYRGLYLIGDGSADSDYLDVIVRTGEEELVAQATVEFLVTHRNQWDILFLNEVPSVSPNLRLFRQLLREEACYWEEVELPRPYVALPSCWDDYLKSLKPRKRKHILYFTRRLEQNFNVHFDYCQHAGELEPRLESLFALHGQRWRLKGEAGTFISAARRGLYQEISALFLSRGWLRFYSLAVNGHYVAHQYCFKYQNTMFVLQEGFDPTWAQYDIGNVLRTYVFRDCIEKKVTVYDFLGAVTPHKLSWGVAIKQSVRIASGLPTTKNRIFFSQRKAATSVKEGLKTILPETVLARVWSLRTRGLFAIIRSWWRQQRRR